MTDLSLNTDQKVPILQMQGISKKFLRVQANQNIDFELYPKEVCALLGENGAGKTTLMNILFGLYRPDEGTIFVGGKEVEIHSPHDAITLGIGMVHQHFNLVERHRVWENIVLGIQDGFLLNKAKALSRIESISKDFGLKIDPEAYIWQLSVGEKQRVEIIKALVRGIKILVLDEPTSVLTPPEVESLFATLNDMVKRDLSVVFISHKLKEVMAISDRVVVLRRGNVLKTVLTKDTNVEELTELMIGEESFPKLERKKADAGTEILQVEQLRVESDMGLEAVKSVSFNIREGEILGLAGVSGNGQRELAEVLNGTREALSGKIHFDGRPVPFLSPSHLVKIGWGRIPEDRMVEGAIQSMSLVENCLLETYDRPEFRKSFLLDFKAVKSHTQDLIDRYNIRPALTDIPVHQLSGGNLQKLILAREFALQPRMIIASQPTRGLDVKAVSFIQRLLLQEREKGTAILLISEDLDEIMELSDRIAVIYEGQILDIVARENVNRARIGKLMAGIREQEDAEQGKITETRGSVE